MLFDTSSPGRKRFVQVIFASLAILMGGGLVLFGIGSSQQGGGITEIFNGSNSTSTVGDEGEKDVEAAQKVLDKNPRDLEAAERLARGRLAIATSEALDAQGNVNPDGGQAMIDAADSAWTKYLALGPAEPDRAVSSGYSAFYAAPGVSKYDKAARALEATLVTREPTAGLYATLSLYWLFGGSDDKYKEARERAIAAADSDTRKDAIREQLDDYKKQYDDAVAAQAKQAEEAQEAQGGSGSGGGTTPRLPTLPTLQ